MSKRYEIFRGAMATLGLIFNREPGPIMDVYWEVLAPLGDEEMGRAFGVATARCKFFPVPAELLEFARPARTVAQRAAAAWGVVREAMRKHDYTVASIDLGPLVNTVIRAMGGWQWLCDQTREELVWREKDFVRYFDAYASGPVAALRPEPLEGWGVGRVGCERVAVAIEGEAAPLDPKRAISAPTSSVATLVRQLAESKSKTGGAALPVPAGQSDAGVAVAVHGPATDDAGVSNAPLAPREAKLPTRITEEEKAVAVARMEAQLAARGVTVGSAKSTEAAS